MNRLKISLKNKVKNRIEITPTVLEETYSCEEFVGKTRHGEIYKARNVEDSMDYAVKIIDTLDYSLELKKLFDNNSELLRLGHDNILQTFHYSISLDSNEGNTFQIISLKIQFLDNLSISENLTNISDRNRLVPTVKRLAQSIIDKYSDISNSESNSDSEKQTSSSMSSSSSSLGMNHFNKKYLSLNLVCFVREGLKKVIFITF